ncbi:hypothetical protein RJ639_004019 [Escallonia herrerae]|uniref:Endoglucanase n=1 Tax=Escallonia herrerae TaxID=1293975 RepID=A0AA88W776_9ASTE|nr:hypothetical protein RJ639_004019 [Escallonia herrerae]
MEAEKKPKSKSWCLWFFVLVLAAVVVAAASITLRKDLDRLKSKNSHASVHPGAIVARYGDALSIAMQFLDIQKSGKLVNNKIAWRADSGLQDGEEENLDLSKGVYDAGDLVKFGFPMAFTATVLSWAILEYGDQMKAVKELQHARDSLKWITDCLINAHPSDNVLYIQAGDPELDHKCWERPEVMTERRPSTQANISYPGSEVAAETAAAMASASLVFKKVNSTYSKNLLRHAQELFRFADTYRGSYSISIPQVQNYYNSSGYEDELLWAASWLYHATEDQLYLRYKGNCLEAPNLVLLSRVNFFGRKDMSGAENIGLQMYRKTAESVMCGLLPDSPTATSSRTDGGLIWVSEWNALQYPMASAFLALVYSDYMLSSQTSTLYCNGKLYNRMDLPNFAILQAEYVLGNNPMKLSYLVGYGSNYPRFVHHRGASIPVTANTGCEDGFKWLNSTDSNPNVAVGALVGGPFVNETYIDSRNNSMQGEPTTYNSAIFIGLLSGLVRTSSVVRDFT